MFYNPSFMSFECGVWLKYIRSETPSLGVRYCVPLRYTTILRLKEVSFDPRQLNQEKGCATELCYLIYLLSLDSILFSFLPLWTYFPSPISGHTEVYSWCHKYVTSPICASAYTVLSAQKEVANCQLMAGSSPQICFIWTSLYFSLKFEPTFKNQKASHEILDFWLCLEHGNSGNIVSAFIQGSNQPQVINVYSFRWNLHLIMTLLKEQTWPH